MHKNAVGRAARKMVRQCSRDLRQSTIVPVIVPHQSVSQLFPFVISAQISEGGGWDVRARFHGPAPRSPHQTSRLPQRTEAEVLPQPVAEWAVALPLQIATTERRIATADTQSQRRMKTRNIILKSYVTFKDQTLK